MGWTIQNDNNNNDLETFPARCPCGAFKKVTVLIIGSKCFENRQMSPTLIATTWGHTIEFQQSSLIVPLFRVWFEESCRETMVYTQICPCSHILIYNSKRHKLVNNYRFNCYMWKHWRVCVQTVIFLCETQNQTRNEDSKFKFLKLRQGVAHGGRRHGD